MRPFAISRLETSVHVLEADRADPPEQQMRFRLRTLSGSLSVTRAGGVLEVSQRREVLRLIMGTAATSPAAAAGVDACRKALEYALVGWENVADGEGKPTPWPGNALRALDLLPPEGVLALGAEVISRSEIGSKAGNG